MDKSSDHLGSYNIISTDNKVVSERHHFDPWGNRKNPANWLAADTRTSFLFDRGFTGHEHLDSFKIINMNARLYDPVISRFFSPDPYVQLPEFTQAFNRYSYCLNNPLKYVDPSGELLNPIFDFSGNFLGTDDRGLKGEAIVMKQQDFYAGMDHNEALLKGMTLDKFPVSNSPFINKINEQMKTFPNRPDWDGKLTLKEANDWYRTGDGKPLYVALNQINLHGIYSLGEKDVGKIKAYNLCFDSGSLEDAAVYGTITLKHLSNHTVRAYSDIYDVDMKSWSKPSNWGRNIETKVGEKVAGQGKAYEIIIYGSAKLKPLFPWIK